jgi:hypothetical protein
MASIQDKNSNRKGKYTLEIVFILAFAIAAGVVFAI